MNSVKANPDAYAALGTDILGKIQGLDMNFLGLEAWSSSFIFWGLFLYFFWISCILGWMICILMVDFCCLMAKGISSALVTMGLRERLLLAPIRFYQKRLSPLKPSPTCRFI